jgi:hypothetical protein
MENKKKFKMPPHLRLKNNNKLCNEEKAILRFLNGDIDMHGLMDEADKCYIAEKKQFGQA